MIELPTEEQREPGDDLLVYGSADVVDQLTNEGLIDEYRLMVYPVVVGSGKRLFAGSDGATLRLLGASTTGTGVVVLDYARADA